jgi:DNA-binding transcriptional MocR family regulator
MTSPLDKGYAYQAVYAYVATLIAEVTGERRVRLPSLRDLAERLGVSLSTVKHAYQLLESEGRIYSVAKSGYYAAPAPEPRAVSPQPEADLLQNLFRHACSPGMLALHRSDPWPAAALGLLLTRAERDIQRQQPNLPSHPFGDAELRREIAARYTRSTAYPWTMDDVFLGPDLRAVVDIALDALGVHGQTVLVVSPLCPRLIQALRAAGASIQELPLDSRGNLDIERTARVLCEKPVALALLNASLNGPQGTVMPEDTRQRLAALLNHHGIWVLEDDDHAALCFTTVTPLRELLDPARLLICGSFARMIGAEARYGYLLCRPLQEAVQARLLCRDLHLAPVRQKAIARLCRRAAIDRHMAPLRVALQGNMARLVQQLDEQLGDLLAITMPAGGTGIWARSRYPINGRELYARLASRHILIAPGELFSSNGYHHQSLRVGCPVHGNGLPGRVAVELRRALRQTRC